MRCYFIKELNISFDAAIAKVTEELKKEGFGILTDIDVKATLKKNWMWTSVLNGFWAPVIRPLLFRHYKLRIKSALYSPVTWWFRKRYQGRLK